MSDYSDGSMIVNTEIDTEGFKKDSEKLEKAVASLSKRVESIGQQMKTAIAKNNTSAMESLNRQFSESQTQVDALRRKMEAFSHVKILSDDYIKTTKEIEKTEEALSRLMERQEKMRELGKQSIEAQKEKLRQQMEAELQAKVWKIPTRLFVYLIALIIMVVATAYTSGLTVNTFLLCVLNAFIVALAAYGSYELTFAKIDE